MNKQRATPEIKITELTTANLMRIGEPAIIMFYTQIVGVFVPARKREEAQQVLDLLATAHGCNCDADDCADGA